MNEARKYKRATSFESVRGSKEGDIPKARGKIEPLSTDWKLVGKGGDFPALFTEKIRVGVREVNSDEGPGADFRSLTYFSSAVLKTPRKLRTPKVFLNRE